MHKKTFSTILAIPFFFIIISSLAYVKIDDNKTKISFWNSRKKGTNVFNKNISTEDIQAAKDYGFDFIRLVPDKFLTEKRDFLIGDADNYSGLVDADLTKLKEILDICTQIDMPVVLS